jgi:hypothetical protein
MDRDRGGNMTGRPPWLAFGELDGLGASSTCAVLSGALSLLAPFLIALTGTLVALSVAGWCSRMGRDPRPLRAAIRPDRGAALVAIALAVAFSLSTVGESSPFRGLALGLGAVPLAWVEHRRATGVSGTETRT